MLFSCESDTEKKNACLSCPIKAINKTPGWIIADEKGKVIGTTYDKGLRANKH